MGAGPHLPHWRVKCRSCWYEEPFWTRDEAYIAAAEHQEAAHGTQREIWPTSSIDPIRYDMASTERGPIGIACPPEAR